MPEGPVLVTGGSGWLGRWVRRVADDLGIDVVAVARTGEGGCWPWDPGDRAGVAAAMAAVAPSAVLHLAGRARGTVEELRDANVRLLDDVVTVAAERGTSVVAVGSAGEIGDPGTARPVDEHVVLAPRSDYGRTKAEGAALVRAASTAGARATWARLFNVVAADLPIDNPVAEFAAKVRALGPGGGEVEVGNAATTRDLVTARFASEALLALVAARPAPPTVNVCSGVGHTFGDVVLALGRRAGVAVTVRSLGLAVVPAVVGDPRLLAEVTGLAEPLDVDGVAAAALG